MYSIVSASSFGIKVQISAVESRSAMEFCHPIKFRRESMNIINSWRVEKEPNVRGNAVD